MAQPRIDSFNRLVQWYMRQLVDHDDKKSAETVQSAMCNAEPGVALSMAVYYTYRLGVVPDREILEMTIDNLDDDDDSIDICEQMLSEGV